MSAEFPMFVFVGTAARRAELDAQAADRGLVLFDAPEDPLYGTLAQVVAFFPDAAVIEDTGDDIVREIVMHLNSINFEPIVLLSDVPGAWDIPEGARMVVLPRQTTAYEIFDAMRALLVDAEPIWA